jgi:hypothetical protein
MKTIIIIFAALLSMASFAHEIKGTPVLKGSIKSKTVVNNQPATCKVRVSKVKNLMLEDSFGNPAYDVRMTVGLESTKQESRIAFEQEVRAHNLFTTATGTEVRDNDYVSKEGVQMTIDEAGRIKKVVFPYQGQQITCAF